MIICVTGPMAAGKNFVSSLIEKETLKGKKFVSSDLDKIGHEVLFEKETIKKVTEAFGEIAEKQGLNIIDENGNLLRRNLGAILFKNPELLKKHEEIIYPEMNKKILDFVKDHKNENIIINAAALYKIPSLLSLCDAIIYVSAPLFTRLKRAIKRDNMKISQILQRFYVQKDLFSKYSKSNADIYRVNNTGNLKRLKKRLENILAKL